MCTCDSLANCNLGHLHFAAFTHACTLYQSSPRHHNQFNILYYINSMQKITRVDAPLNSPPEYCNSEDFIDKISVTVSQ